MLVFQKNVKMLEIGIRRGVIILTGDIKSDHRHRQVAYDSSCYKLLAGNALILRGKMLIIF